MNVDIAREKFETHRINHGCKTNLCEKGKKLRKQWTDLYSFHDEIQMLKESTINIRETLSILFKAGFRSTQAFACLRQARLDLEQLILEKEITQ